jgi:MFS superfamily sulfate permease-like transporter
LSTLKEFAERHPQLIAWWVLAVGMVVILLWSARGVGLLPGQMIALVVTTVLLAGLCVWIIGWEDEEAEEIPKSPPGEE